MPFLTGVWCRGSRFLLFPSPTPILPAHYPWLKTLVYLLLEVLLKLTPPNPVPAACELESWLLNAAEPLCHGLVKNHITDLVSFFSPSWFDENKTTVRREKGEVAVNCLMEMRHSVWIFNMLILLNKRWKSGSCLLLACQTVANKHSFPWLEFFITVWILECNYALYLSCIRHTIIIPQLNYLFITGGRYLFSFLGGLFLVGPLIVLPFIRMECPGGGPHSEPLACLLTVWTNFLVPFFHAVGERLWAKEMSGL